LPLWAILSAPDNVVGFGLEDEEKSNDYGVIISLFKEIMHIAQITSCVNIFGS
jgi:hypothetical protein